MSAYLGAARIDERGRANGGVAGDQTGGETSVKVAYMHSKGWLVFRAYRAKTRKKLAYAMSAICYNPMIGYDQYQNTTLWKDCDNRVDYDPYHVAKPVETDCCRAVRLCCEYAGVHIADCYTATLPGELRKSNKFEEVKLKTLADLREGDILVTPVKGHTEICVKDGVKTVHDMALDVIDGYWHSGACRKNCLITAHWDYNEVQKEVNKILKGV